MFSKQSRCFSDDTLKRERQTLISHFLRVGGGSGQKLGGHLPRSMGRAVEEALANGDPHGTARARSDGDQLRQFCRGGSLSGELRFSLAHIHNRGRISFLWVFSSCWGIFTGVENTVLATSIEEVKLYCFHFYIRLLAPKIARIRLCECVPLLL